MTSRGLPYGAVMATAGTSTLAGYCGLTELVVPLLVLAMLQALWVPVAAARRYRSSLVSTSFAMVAACEQTGMHTVPLGLAVIAGGLAGLRAAAPWLVLPLAALCLALAWLLAMVCIARLLWSLARYGLSLQMLDGSWFLVPAAVLGPVMATEEIVSSVSGWEATGLNLLALAGAVIGWLGYWLVAMLAAIRVWRLGLGGVAQAPWWIAMGCAGLAAAALGGLLDGSVSWPLPLATLLMLAMYTSAVCALVLFVPLIVGGADFLLQRCRFHDIAAWPPTFSTVVFALGCLQAGEVLRSPVFRLLGLGAGFAALMFWAVTAGWNTKRRMAAWV